MSGWLGVRVWSGSSQTSAADDRRRHAAVVEQRGVRGEPLLPHQLLVVEVARRGRGTGCAASGDLTRPAGSAPCATRPIIEFVLCLMDRVATVHDRRTDPALAPAWSTTPRSSRPATPRSPRRWRLTPPGARRVADLVGSFVLRDTDLPQVPASPGAPLPWSSPAAPARSPARWDRQLGTPARGPRDRAARPRRPCRQRPAGGRRGRRGPRPALGPTTLPVHVVFPRRNRLREVRPQAGWPPPIDAGG